MSTTLYRKYRPQTFAELQSQEHVIRTLQGALASGRVGHAYLFAGPRGTGKTTMARLMAKAINCQSTKSQVSNPKQTPNYKFQIEPCNECNSCISINAGRSLDLIEIDAASNRGIDEIRNLKEAAGTAASSSRYKIFIIDEVHMLTKEAFNALLKTLEEPPSHIVFMLATTEPHKLPETILSRVQRFDFRKHGKDEIVKKLKKIAGSEKIIIDDESLELIAVSASGSMRDAESALGKVIAFCGTTIVAEQTSMILGIIPEHAHAEFLKNIIEKKSTDAIAQIAVLYESGVSMEQFCAQFLNYIRRQLIESLKNNRDPKPLVRIIEAFFKAKSELKSSPIPQLPLELAAIELSL